MVIRSCARVANHAEWLSDRQGIELTGEKKDELNLLVAAVNWDLPIDMARTLYELRCFELHRFLVASRFSSFRTGPIAMAPTHRSRKRHGCTQWLVRAAALTLTLHGHAVAAQADTHAHGASSPDAGLADYIRFAVLPLPEQMRADATVMRPDSTGRPVVVRRGTNGIACMRFVPGEGAWDARCYEETMFQVVLRMRELFRSGVAPGSIGPRIDAEMKAGTLKVPARPAVGYRVLGGRDAYDPATGIATPQLDIWQSIHVPFATAEQLGFPDESTVSDSQRREIPFVMASGTGWAHVMINHPMPPATNH